MVARSSDPEPEELLDGVAPDDSDDDADDDLFDDEDLEELAAGEELEREPDTDEDDDTEEVVDPAGLEDADEPADDEDVQDPAVAAVVTGEAAFDDEEDAGVAAALEDDELDGGIEGLRDGEFVCRSCYMAKAASQLADADALLCRDCA